MGSRFLIIGSGAGGATLAKELATRGKNVAVVEKGGFHKVGTERRALKFYTGRLGPAEVSDEGIELFRAIMVGGTTTVTLGNGVRALQEELEQRGVGLEKEFKEAEKELGVAPMPESLMGERARALRDASLELGYEVKPMPKFIDFKRCRSCGLCVTGCQYGAKWTALKPLAEARRAGARLLTNTAVEEVLHQGGEVKGVRARGPSGSRELLAEKVILSAGGLGTPVILQRSGLEAGDGLFADLFVNTYGMIEERGMEDEQGMATVIDQFHDSDGFIISPILDTRLHMFLSLPLLRKARALKRDRMLGLMTKIADDSFGKVDSDGKLHKPLTENDLKKLEKGVELCEKILSQAGADPNSFLTTRVRGAHPGGTAAVGRVTNREFETEVDGLFVCDASLLPKAPGNPPVLTIVALAKKLGARLAAE